MKNSRRETNDCMRGWLRRQMAGRDISQGELARQIGVSRATVCRWLRGNRTPSWRGTVALIRTFGLPPENDGETGQD